MRTKERILISFLKEIEKAKLVERHMWCSDRKRKESVAEHCWHLAMFLFVFEGGLPRNINLLRTLKILLMRDLVEIYAGDTFLFAPRAKKRTKKTQETKAAKKLFSKLPRDSAKEFAELFHEYEEMKTRESKIAHALDKLQPILQNIVSGGRSWKKHRVTEELIHSHKRRYMQTHPFIARVYDELIREAKRKKLF